MLASTKLIDGCWKRLTYLLIDAGLFFFDLLFQSLQARSVRRSTVGL